MALCASQRTQAKPHGELRDERRCRGALPRSARRNLHAFGRSLYILTHAIVWIPLTGIPGMLALLLTPFIGAPSRCRAAVSLEHQALCHKIRVPDATGRGAGLTRAQRITWRCACVYFKITLSVSDVAYSVIGLENLDPAGHYFFACNHESIYDIPLVFAALPYWLIAIAK
jgi:hypothetical protein